MEDKRDSTHDTVLSSEFDALEKSGVDVYLLKKLIKHLQNENQWDFEKKLKDDFE